MGYNSPNSHTCPAVLLPFSCAVPGGGCAERLGKCPEKSWTDLWWPGGLRGDGIILALPCLAILRTMIPFLGESGVMGLWIHSGAQRRRGGVLGFAFPNMLLARMADSSNKMFRSDAVSVRGSGCLSRSLVYVFPPLSVGLPPPAAR